MRYLQKVSTETESAMLAKYPIKHNITQDVAKLEKLKDRIDKEAKDIQALIDKGSVLALVKIDMTFQAASDELAALSYLSNLSEGFLFQNFGAALRDHENTSAYDGFTQRCRDTLARLKYRTLADCPQPQANIKSVIR